MMTGVKHKTLPRVAAVATLLGLLGSDSLAMQISRCLAPAEGMTRYLAEYDAFFRGTGGTAAIALDGRIVYSGAWGLADLEHNVPTQVRTRFFIASVTKAFTGVALLKAAEQGYLSVETPISTYVPRFAPPEVQSVTLSLLAAHLGGVREWRSEERSPAFLSIHHDDVSDVLTLLAADSLVSAPGTRYVYSSLGYNLLAAAIQAATGQPFQAYITRQILGPVALTQTSVDDARAIVPHRAPGYSYWYPWFSRQASDTLRRVPSFDYSANIGGGNMLSTSEDLVRFGSPLLRPGLLSAASLQMLRSRIAPGSNWSYGFTVSPDSVAGTQLRITGSDPGYQASLSIYPDRRLVVALLQNSWGIRATPPARYADPVATLISMCLGTAPR